MNRLLTLCCAVALMAALAFAQPKPKSQKEGEAVMAIFNAQTPDARIAAVESLLTNFADTDFKAVALQVAAQSAEMKGDVEKTIIYSERTLEADPKNYPAMLMIARATVQRTREFDLDREEKLGRVDKMAKQGIELAQAAPKPRPDIPDEQWEAAKKEYVAQGHEALGMAAVTRKKFDVAIAEYKAALDSSPQPDAGTMVRLAAAYNESGKPDEAIAMLDKVNTVQNLHPAIKQVAANERAKAMRLKGGGAAKPAAPAAGSTATPAPAPTPVPTPAAPKQ
jgi:tetratricopeptide (TPR) repeat protein